MPGELSLFLVFCKFGLLCFGGGYMLVPLLTSELVGPGRPLSGEEFSQLVSIAQITPGPIGINTATYTGYLQYGLAGALIASLALVLPGYFLAILALKVLKRHSESVWIKGFLAGMRPASFGLIVAAALIFAELSVFSGEIPWLDPQALLSGAVRIRLPELAIAAATAILMLKIPKCPFMPLIIAGAAAGALLCAG